ncbi:phosphoprotein phosphatase 1 [Trichinella spiralis]|uniref:phosphoprotein phosphatase 1 n=1 Tax=Trichinella spiralis TaxID=6334 RepID=UPI0001EFD3A0|nr:phosphoprotein phosphatase 1 [Trichinella spiralis]
METNLENAAKYEQLLIRLREFSAGDTLPMEEPLLTDIFKNVSKILLKEESLLELELPLVICGDIHGNFCQLLRIFNRIGWPPKVRYLFLGDYIDRGYRNLEVIALLFTLKILYPEAVFLLRGNHEASPVNRNYGFKQEVRNRGFSTLFWLTAQITFNCLPLAAVIASKIFCAHGGISPFLKDFDQIRNFQRPLNVPSDGLIADLLWADPSSDIENFALNEIRNTSVMYGKNAVMQFCKDFSIDLIIRAHERGNENDKNFPFACNHNGLMKTCISFTSCVDLEVNNVSVVLYYCSYVGMDMKQQFDKRLAEIVIEMSGNNVVYSQTTYAGGASSADDHNIKRRFEVLIIGEEQKLI